MRRTDMRNRIVALAAVSAFAIGLAGVALVAARSGGTSLQPLPTLAGGREAVGDMAALGGAAFAPAEYVVEGSLPDLPLEAPAFRLPDVEDADAVADVAKALGVEGEPRKDDAVYVVFGGTRTLTVDTRSATWYLTHGCLDRPVASDGSVSAMGCASSAVAKACVDTRVPPGSPQAAVSCAAPSSPEGGGSSGSAGSHGSSGSGHAVEPCPPCALGDDCQCGRRPGPGITVPPQPVAPPPQPVTPPPAADLPDRAGAERIARDVFGRLGVPLDTLRLEGGQWSWQASVSPPVGGVSVIGLGHSLTIGPKGEVTGAHGYLGRPRRIGDYPLAGVQAGLDRLRDGRGVGVGGGGMGRPEPAIDMPAQAGTHVVTLTGVRLGLQLVDRVLVPVYVFEVKGGGELTVPAVVDRYLAQHHPSPEPDIGPPPSSGSCSGSASGVGGGDDVNHPLTVDVCVQPTKAKVGEPITFTVTITDPDAEIYDGRCEGPVVAFGDEGEVMSTLCGHVCGAGSKPPSVKDRKRGELEKTFTHAYAKAGTYTARFSYRSDLCSVWSSAGEGTATVVVVE